MEECVSLAIARYETSKNFWQYNQLWKKYMFCALLAVQTENRLKTLVITVSQNMNDDVLITVHKNESVKLWVHQMDLSSTYDMRIKTSRRHFLSGGAYKYQKCTQTHLPFPASVVSYRISFYHFTWKI